MHDRKQNRSTDSDGRPRDRKRTKRAKSETINRKQQRATKRAVQGR